MAGVSASTKRLIALILGLALAITIILVAATSGLGSPGVPAGSVALVEDVENGAVSDDDYQRGLEQATARLGLEEVPAADSPEFQQVSDEAMQGLLLERWAAGEAADRGIEVTDTDVQDELAQIQEGFQNEKEFARVVRRSKFCTQEEIDGDVPPIECGDVVKQGRLLALQRKLSEAFASEPDVTDEEVEEFYEANLESFQTPSSRSARVILNEDEAKVEEARSELEGLTPDDEGYADAWRKAAKEFSQDQASKDRGGLLEGLVEGQGDPQLDAVLFATAEGEFVGPFETDRGFYLAQVVTSQEASTQSLEEASETIRQQLVAARQQAEQTQVQNDFVEKWTARTFCDEEVAMQFCSNFVPPEPEQIPGQEVPQPPPVQSSRPIEPGSASISIDGTTQTGRPQGPQVPPPDPADATGIPPGLDPSAIPVGPDGAPVDPAAGGAPQGTAPPAGAP